MHFVEFVLLHDTANLNSQNYPKSRYLQLKYFIRKKHIFEEPKGK